jgi:TusA-related sulfurtransferase
MNHELDLTGLKCPLVTNRIRKHSLKLLDGTTLKVYSDDHEAKVDIPALILKAGWEYVSYSEGTKFQTYEIKIKKKS